MTPDDASFRRLVAAGIITPDERPPAPVERFWADLGFAGFLCRGEVLGTATLRFDVYEVAAVDTADTRLYLQRDWKDSGDMVERVEDAHPYLSGSLKWDGCLNVDFGTGHYCGRGAAANLGAVLGRVFDLGAEVIPSWDASLAD